MNVINLFSVMNYRVFYLLLRLLPAESSPSRINRYQAFYLTTFQETWARIEQNFIVEFFVYSQTAVTVTW